MLRTAKIQTRKNRRLPDHAKQWYAITSTPQYVGVIEAGPGRVLASSQILLNFFLTPW